MERSGRPNRGACRSLFGAPGLPTPTPDRVGTQRRPGSGEPRPRRGLATASVTKQAMTRGACGHGGPHGTGDEPTMLAFRPGGAAATAGLPVRPTAGLRPDHQSEAPPTESRMRSAGAPKGRRWRPPAAPGTRGRRPRLSAGAASKPIMAGSVTRRFPPVKQSDDKDSGSVVSGVEALTRRRGRRVRGVAGLATFSFRFRGWRASRPVGPAGARPASGAPRAVAPGSVRRVRRTRGWSPLLGCT